jgi:hypothetical protein
MTRAIIIFLVIVVAVSGSTVFAFQDREHLTPEEIELVKDAQLLDKRIDIFIKAVDRRVLVLNGASSSETTSAKQLKKDSETWGELPKGSRAELIGDIAGIFDEAITNIDDVSGRDENNPLIPKSLRKLSAAAARVVETLKPIAKSDDELTRFDQLTENAEQIIQAANKLPPPSEKKGKNKTEKAKE